jgi:DNA-binding transcriptional ArsR family regulator
MPSDTASNILKGGSHPVRAKILALLAAAKEPMTPLAFAEATGSPLGVVSYHTRMLRQYGLIVLERMEPRRGALQHYYAITNDGRTANSAARGVDQSYTDRAVDAVIEAVRDQYDFGGWLGQVLAAAAAELGSTDELTAGRPGSWEAQHVQGLAKGTAGWDDETLEYRRRIDG